MRQETGYEYATQSFFGTSRNERLCDECNTPFKEGALDFLSDEFVCPYCENGKDD
jgi:formylmethanofuran dehydrogenase subunit E